MSIPTKTDLFQKYDIPAPRYTSYPTVPYWNQSPTLDQWKHSLTETLKKQSAAWSMYIHVPFCESLCTFCGCNTSINRNHKTEAPYVQRLLKEKQSYFAQIPDFQNRTFKHIHLGGGSPTFLSPEQLDILITGLLKNTRRDVDFEASIEVDPRRTTTEQLAVLRKHGFNRVSLGVQDFDAEVQRLINRTQSFEQTQTITNEARKLGYTSVNFDLIYGLPKQTKATISEMISKTLLLMPDRIALYSFALVPWIKPGQRLFKDEDLPRGAEKRELYEIARGLLIDGGYVEIGMDHFALPTDALAKSSKTHSLHRNFMGYTDQKSDILLGLGVSSISESPDIFYQNEKVLPKYEALIDQTGFAPLRGHVLNEEDLHTRQQILDLMCKGETHFSNAEEKELLLPRMQEFLSDGLATLTTDGVRIEPQGKPFLRNLCLAFDRRFFRDQPSTRIFSQSI